MPPELVRALLKGSEYIAENCLYDTIVITAEGVALENRKEFHPASETLID